MATRSTRAWEGGAVQLDVLSLLHGWSGYVSVFTLEGECALEEVLGGADVVCICPCTPNPGMSGWSSGWNWLTWWHKRHLASRSYVSAGMWGSVTTRIADIARDHPNVFVM